MGFAGRVSALLFLLVAGAVATDQIFTSSGERRGAALDLTGAIEVPRPLRVSSQNPMNLRLSSMSIDVLSNQNAVDRCWR